MMVKQANAIQKIKYLQNKNLKNLRKGLTHDTGNQLGCTYCPLDDTGN